VTLINVESLMNSRIPVRTSLSDWDLMVESTSTGVNEGSMERRYATKPVTYEAAPEVPVRLLVPPSFQVEITSDPERKDEMVSVISTSILAYQEPRCRE